MGKQHKDCRKMPISLDSVEAGIDTLIDILQQLKQDKDYYKLAKKRLINHQKQLKIF